jgi:hypothetical protein
LQKPATLRPSVRETAETFILDSGIGDDVTNAEVLDLAEQYNADFVVAKDYLHDHDKTTESIHEFIDLYESHPCDATPMIPLQPPHADHYQDVPGFDTYVLGGMATGETTDAQAIKWVREFRDVAPDVYAHGLGVGGGIEFTRAVASKGWLDSIDCSTPEVAASFGCVLDEQLRQQQVRVMNGDGASKRNIPLGTFNSYQIQDVWDREADTKDTQTKMDVYQ